MNRGQKLKNVVVIGGSGFVGSTLADCLSDAGYKVTVFDKRQSEWLREDQRMIVGDISDQNLLDKSIAEANYVFNFAGVSDLNDCLLSPKETISSNIMGNVNVLEACVKNKITKFFYASTIYVHSVEGGFYRCSKQAAESYIEEYHKMFALNYTIIRFGSLYGPRSNEKNGLYRLASTALSEGIIRYHGHIDTLREYIHVEDAVRACVEILESATFLNENVVLTGQESMKVADMLKMMAEILRICPDAIEFTGEKAVGHYTRTPYAFQPRLGRKYRSQTYVDLGQGLLQLINYVNSKQGQGAFVGIN